MDLFFGEHCAMENGHCYIVDFLLVSCSIAMLVITGG